MQGPEPPVPPAERPAQPSAASSDTNSVIVQASDVGEGVAPPPQPHAGPDAPQAVEEQTAADAGAHARLSSHIDMSVEDCALGLLRLSFTEHDADPPVTPVGRPAIRLPSPDMWEGVPLWPQQGNIGDLTSAYGAPAPLFTLQAAGERFGGVAVQLQGANSQLRDGTLRLPPHVTLVIDGTCGDVEFTNVTFSGAPRCCSRLFSCMCEGMEASVCQPGKKATSQSPRKCCRKRKCAQNCANVCVPACRGFHSGVPWKGLQGILY